MSVEVKQNKKHENRQANERRERRCQDKIMPETI
jgi:hypothetical protein